MEKIRISITTLLLAVLVFYLTAWFIPAIWNWSVFDFASISPLNIGFIVVVALVILIPRVSNQAYDSLAVFLITFNKGLSRLPSALRLLLWVVIPGLILFGLKSNCHILGDGNLILSHISAGNLISTTAVGVSLLVKYLYTALNNSIGISPTSLMQALSIGCGIIFFYFVYQILDFLIADIKARLLMYTVLCLSAIIVLFTGYVETYPILIAWLSIYLYSAIRYMKTGRGFKTALILFLIGVFWHIWFLAFSPSLLYLFNLRFKKVSSKTMVLLSVLFIAGIYLGGLLIKRTGIPLVLPFLPGQESHYLLFSIDHLLDFANQLIITGPVIVLLALLLFLYKMKDKSVRHITFLSFAAFPALLIAFMIDPALGAIRDWDMLSIFVLPLSLIGVTLLAGLIKSNANIRYLVIPVLLLGVMHTSGFILNNKSTDQAVSRVVRVLIDDPHYQADYYEGKRITPFSTILSNVYDRFEDGTRFMEKYNVSDKTDNTNYMNLALQYYNSEDYENAQHYFGLLPNELIPKLEYYFAYGESLYRTHRYAQAIKQLNIVLRDTSFTKLHYILGSAYLGAGQPDSAVKYYDMAYDAQADTISFLQNSAHNFSYFKYHDYAIKYYKALYELNPDLENLKTEIATTYHSLMQPDSAFKYYLLVLKDDPHSFNTLYNVSQLYIETNEYSEALSVLDLIDSLYPNNASVLAKTGYTLQRLGRHDEALEVLQRALRIMPQDFTIRHLIAREYYTRDSFKVAIRHWNEILEQDPNYVAAYYSLGQCYDKLGEDLMAKESLRQWLRIYPDGTSLPEAVPLLRKYGLVK